MIFFKVEYKEIHKYSDMILKMIAVSLIKLKKSQRLQGNCRNKPRSRNKVVYEQIVLKK